MTWLWLPYALAALTALSLARFFWIGSQESVSVAHAVVTAALIIGVVASIRIGDVSAPSNGPRRSEVAAAAETSVPVSVQGAVETREQEARIVACEAALQSIAGAVREAATGGAPVDPARVDPAAVATPAGTLEARLESCEVRLQAIAATLPR